VRWVANPKLPRVEAIHGRAVRSAALTRKVRRGSLAWQNGKSEEASGNKVDAIRSRWRVLRTVLQCAAGLDWAGLGGALRVVMGI
jgi:hypothetical protein